jgi:hypothetical protein
VERPLVIVDRHRLRQFALVGRARRLFAETSRTTVTDSVGVRWAVARVGDDAFAVPALGPGWVFDPAIAALRAKALEELRERVRKDADRALFAAVAALQLGGRCERVLWSLHRHLVAARRSVFRVPDVTLAGDVYGADIAVRPAHWRSDLSAILTGLTRLHVGECDGDTLPTFGTTTALLNAVADLRGQPGDACGSDCPLHGQGPHHHFQVNAGRGFLGALERLAGPADENGTREYDFNRTSGGQTLGALGKTGRVTEVFLPAVLAEPAARDVLSHGQRDILQALLRERTRGRRARGPAGPEVVTGGRIRKTHGTGLVVCPALDAARRYRGFNGNGVRRGRGYLLATPGGWLAKAGYAPDQLEQFLTDLAALAQALGLVVVAMDPKAEPVWVDPQRLAALARTLPGRAVLRRLYLRVFAEEGWEQRWTRVFVKPVAAPTAGGTTDLAGDLAELPLSQRQLAADLKVDPSFLSKVLNGKKPWPEDLSARARTYLSAKGRQNAPVPGTPASQISVEAPPEA